jgi:menaquinone-dependent protoporphyrinogen oxidase
VLIAFASQQGSTAWVGETICGELRAAGLAVDCQPAAAVTDLEPYTAVVLGSGVFLARRASDGGGFITRHREALAERPVWLFSAGPIGGTGSSSGDDAGCEEAPVVCVARDIGAKGAATFGAAPIVDGTDDRSQPGRDWRELARVRSWARTIADELARAGRAAPAGAPRRVAPPPMFHRAAPTS